MVEETRGGAGREPPAADGATGRYDGPEGQRGWRLAVPRGTEARGALPMLVVLHGCLQDAADFTHAHLPDIAIDQAGIAMPDAKDFDAHVDAGAHDSANGCVHTGRVSAAGQYCNTL